MKAFFLFLLSISLISCEKATDPLKAAFEIQGDPSNVPTLATSEVYSFNNTSINGTRYEWDFGNGTTSNDKNPSITYLEGGEYIITLRVSDENSKIVSASKKVKVLDRVLKQIIIKSIDLSFLQTNPGRPPLNFDVWVEIVKAEENTDYPTLQNGSLDAPLVYKTPTSIGANPDDTPIIFQVNEKVIIDKPTLTISSGYIGNGYGLNLYIEDPHGIYLPSSSYFSGSRLLIEDSLVKRSYVISSSFLGSTVELHCVYE